MIFKTSPMVMLTRRSRASCYLVAGMIFETSSTVMLTEISRVRAPKIVGAKMCSETILFSY